MKTKQKVFSSDFQLQEDTLTLDTSYAEVIFTQIRKGISLLV